MKCVPLPALCFLVIDNTIGSTIIEDGKHKHHHHHRHHHHHHHHCKTNHDGTSVKKHHKSCHKQLNNSRHCTTLDGCSGKSEQLKTKAPTAGAGVDQSGTAASANVCGRGGSKTEGVAAAEEMVKVKTEEVGVEKSDSGCSVSADSELPEVCKASEQCVDAQVPASSVAGPVRSTASEPNMADVNSCKKRVDKPGTVSSVNGERIAKVKEEHGASIGGEKPIERDKKAPVRKRIHCAKIELIKQVKSENGVCTAHSNSTKSVDLQTSKNTSSKQIQDAKEKHRCKDSRSSRSSGGSEHPRSSCRSEHRTKNHVSQLTKHVSVSEAVPTVDQKKTVPSSKHRHHCVKNDSLHKSSRKKDADSTKVKDRENGCEKSMPVSAGSSEKCAVAAALTNGEHSYHIKTEHTSQHHHTSHKHRHHRPHHRSHASSTSSAPTRKVTGSGKEDRASSSLRHSKSRSHSKESLKLHSTTSACLPVSACETSSTDRSSCRGNAAQVTTSCQPKTPKTPMKPTSLSSSKESRSRKKSSAVKHQLADGHSAVASKKRRLDFDESSKPTVKKETVVTASNGIKPHVDSKRRDGSAAALASTTPKKCDCPTAATATQTPRKTAGRRPSTDIRHFLHPQRTVDPLMVTSEVDYRMRRRAGDSTLLAGCRYAHLMHVERDSNGGALVLHSYQDEIDALPARAQQQFADEYFRVAFSEDGDGASRYVIAIVHGAAVALPDPLEFLAAHHAGLFVKIGALGKLDIDTMTVEAFRNEVHASYCAGTHRAGGMMHISMVGVRQEEAGDYLPDYLDIMERNPFLRRVMPWGTLSAVSDMPRQHSNDGPILWSRPGEQVVPPADTGKSPFKRKR